MKSQTTLILEALQNGDKLTPIEALERFGCFRLCARIWEIKAMGFDVKKETIDVGDDGKKVACYYMKQKQATLASIPHGEQARLFS